VRGLMCVTMPSATAWRARSWQVQCVRCSPSAIGSRQASSTIWARCRGGNLLGSPQAGFVQQEAAQPVLLVAAADPPDRGPVAFQVGSDRLDRLAASDGQDDPGVLDLEPGEAPAAGHGLQDREVGIGDRHTMRFSATHGRPSPTGGCSIPKHTSRSNLLHDFLQEPLGPFSAT
jgi:hypothetical protein